MKKWKKLTAGALSVCLLANCVSGLAEAGGLMQASAIIHAETQNVVVTGSCGKNATWNYDRTTKVMTITGTGKVQFEENDASVVRYQNEVKKLIFSDEITAIGDCSFENFTALEEIQFGGVKKIGYFAFKGCTALNGLQLAENLQEIGAWAFSNCKNLTTVTVGSDVKTAYWDIFEGCDNLTSIEIDKNNTSLYADGKELLNTKVSGTCGKNVKYTYDRKTRTMTLSGKGDMKDGDYDYFGLDYKGCDEHTSFLTYDPNKKVIKQEMEKLIAGDKVTSIGDYTFAGCKALKSVKLGKNVWEVGENAFESCTELQSVQLGKNTYLIEGFAFAKCSKLKKVRSTTGLGDIKSYAFLDCKKLKSFTIGEFLSHIGPGVFDGCNSLVRFDVQKKNSYFVKHGNMLLNKSGSRIVSACFGSNKTCTIDESVKNVEYSVLDSTQIKKYVVSKRNKKYSSEDGLLYSKDGKTLYICPEKKTGVVNINDRVTYMYDTAFKGCKKITQINLGKNVGNIDFGYLSNLPAHVKYTISDKNPHYYISDGAIISKEDNVLEYCYETEGDTYTTPASVKKIGQYAFQGLLPFKKIVLSDSVTKIEDWPFWSGKEVKLESIHLGKNYKNKYNDFQWAEGLEGLKEITVSSENPYFSEIDGCLYDKAGKKLLVCPTTVETYKMPASVHSVDDGVDGEEVKELYTNDTVTDLIDWTDKFWKLQTLHIGKNVLTVRKNASLEELSKISVDSENNSFKAVDDVLYTKDGSKLLLCPAKKQGKVVVADGVTTISSRAFDYCKEITDIVIPASVTTIEDNIFNEYVASIVIWVPAGKGEYYKSLFTKETGFKNHMVIMELEG